MPSKLLAALLAAVFIAGCGDDNSSSEASSSTSEAPQETTSTAAPPSIDDLLATLPAGFTAEPAPDLEEQGREGIGAIEGEEMLAEYAVRNVLKGSVPVAIVQLFQFIPTAPPAELKDVVDGLAGGDSGPRSAIEIGGQDATLIEREGVILLVRVSGQRVVVIAGQGRNDLDQIAGTIFPLV